MRADVPQSHCTKHGIDDGVDRCVAVAVAIESLVEGYLRSAQDQSSPLHQGVDIIADADSHASPSE